MVGRTSHRKARTAGEKGQTLVEFALILPVFLLIVMGIFDLGRAVYAYNTLSGAAREGARKAIIMSNSNDVVKQAVVDKAISLNVTTDQVTVSDRSAGSTVTVAVAHPFNFLVPLVADAVGMGTVNLQASSTMRIEGRAP